MVEPINSVESNLKNPEGRATILTEVVRERYWQSLANQAKTVKAEGEAAETGAKKSGEEVVKKEEKTQTASKNGVVNTYAEFTVDAESHEVIVRIYNADNGELVRILPPEKLAEEIANGKFSPSQIHRRNIRL